MSDEQIKEVELVAEENSAVAKMYEEYQSFFVDPEKIFYLEAKETIIALSKEMADARTGGENMFLLKSEDKLFERISSLLINSEKIFIGIRKGRESENQKDDIKEKKLAKSNGVAV